MVLTITDAPISQYDTIIVDVSGIDPGLPEERLRMLMC